MSGSNVPPYSEEELDSFLQRHGIYPANIPEIVRLSAEGNALTAGKRRCLWTPPYYAWEVRYGQWGYQIGPIGCTTALTEAEGRRLRQIRDRLDDLNNHFPYDPETMILTIPCRIRGGTCRHCSPSESGKVRCGSLVMDYYPNPIPGWQAD